MSLINFGKFLAFITSNISSLIFLLLAFQLYILFKSVPTVLEWPVLSFMEVLFSLGSFYGPALKLNDSFFGYFQSTGEPIMDMLDLCYSVFYF